MVVKSAEDSGHGRVGRVGRVRRVPHGCYICYAKNAMYTYSRLHINILYIHVQADARGHPFCQFCMRYVSSGPPSGCGANNQPLSLLIGRAGSVFFKPDLISYAGKVARYKHLSRKQLRHYRCAWQVFSCMRLNATQPIIPEVKTLIPK